MAAFPRECLWGQFVNGKAEYRIGNCRSDDFLGPGIIDVEAGRNKAEVALIEQRNRLLFCYG